MRKKVLVTGASGFIGQHFIKNANEFDIIKVDLLKQSVSDVDFSGVNSVLHLAAYVHQMKGGDSNYYFKVNRDLAFEVAKRAKMQNVKQFVFMSTVKVYGEFTDDNNYWDEESECHPEDDYGKSKLEAEKLILELEDDNFKIAIVRSPLVYGEGVKANMLNLMKLVDRFPVLPLGNINNKRTMVFIGNLISVFQKIIEEQFNGVIIPSDDKSLSTTELVKLISCELNKKLILINANYTVKPLLLFKPILANRLLGSLFLNNEKSKREYDLILPYTIEQGISKMVEWYKKVYKKSN